MLTSRTDTAITTAAVNGRKLTKSLVLIVMLVIDTAFATGTLYFFGLGSAFFVLFPMLIIYYATYFGYASSFASATLIALCYAGLVRFQNAAPPPGLLTLQFLLFYVIALFSGYISEQRRRALREHRQLAVLLQAERGTRAALDMAAGFGVMLEVDELAAKMARLFAQAAGCDAASTILKTGANSFLRIQMAGNGAKSAPAPSLSAVEQRAMEAGEAIESLRPAAEELPAWAASMEPDYAVIMPLLNDGEPIAVLCACGKGQRQALDPLQKKLLCDLAGFFAPIVASANAYAGASKETAKLSSELRGAVQQVVRTQHIQKQPGLRVGHLVLDPAGQKASFGAVRLDLTPREFDVLYCLSQHPERPVSQEVLLRDVWGDRSTHRSNVVDVAINRLRRKLAAESSVPDLIRTVRGVGYALDVQKSSSIPSVELAPPSRPQGQSGVMLLEHVISLAIVAVVVPALLGAMVAVINHSASYQDRTTIVDLATSQMESIQKESYQTNPSGYIVIPAPAGYTVTVSSSIPVTYTYYGGTSTQEILQAITVTVVGNNGSLSVQGYKYRR